jgi:LPXTG-site transpeptidase (sortase) family protein
MKKRKPLSYYFGTTLMLLSAGFLLFIYYPYLLLFITPPTKVQDLHTNFSIEIPKIHAVAPVIPNVNPWNETEYLAALQKGVAQAKGTSLPGQKGTVYLFSHSSDVPWHITRYNIAFFRLGELKQGDAINIYWMGKKYRYSVSAFKTVSPNDISALLETKKNQLILQTCTPVGTSLFRLLVFATPQV